MNYERVLAEIEFQFDELSDDRDNWKEYAKELERDIEALEALFEDVFQMEFDDISFLKLNVGQRLELERVVREALK